MIFLTFKAHGSVVNDYRPFVLISTVLLVLPESATYNLTLVPAMILSLPGLRFGVKSAERLKTKYAEQRRNILVGSCLVCTVPVAIWWVPELAPPGATPLGSIFGFFRGPSLITPITFLVALILNVWLTYRESRAR